MSHRIVLLNGPKTCGKNVLVDRVKRDHPSKIFDRRCKDHLFIATSVMFRMTLEEFFVHYECRETKESPKEEFKVLARAFNELVKITGGQEVWLTSSTGEEATINLSVREALIYVSEVICKTTFGREYFGIARAEDIGTSDSNECAIDDSCGFDDEIGPTIDRLGMDNVMLIRIHGRGSFDGDSRNYISDGVVDNTIDVHNVWGENVFLTQLSRIIQDFYNT